MMWGLLFVAVLVAGLLWWLLIRTEGVYLGKRVVIWLYDVYASRYDSIVQHDTIAEHLHLAQPLMGRIHPETQPLVLDVATGTGRIPLALCHHARFEGSVIGLDLSRRMLVQAARKIHAEHFEDYVTLLWTDGSQLPFDNNTFDVVTCMEALEFMPHPERALRELVRVLRPGGVVLTTRRINEPLMPGRLWAEAEMRHLLLEAGLEQIEFEAWQFDYAKVWGVKSGQSAFIGAMPLAGLLQCRCCDGLLIPQGNGWICPNCEAVVSQSHDGITQLPMRC